MSFARWRFLLVLSVLLCSEAPAEVMEATDEIEQWVPAVSIDTGVLLRSVDGKTATSDLMGPPLPDDPIINEPFTVRPPSDGSQLTPGAIVGSSLELMTPTLAASFGRPRLFVQAGLAAQFRQEHDVSKEGSPGRMGLPPDDPDAFPPAIRFPEDTITGQGSSATVTAEQLVATAAVGVAFTIDWDDRRIRIKPAFQYLWQEYEFEGLTNRAVQLDPTQNFELDDFRLISLSASTTEGYHSIGAGLEIELDTARAGPFMLSIYMSGKVLSVLGSTKASLSDTNQFSESATWDFDIDRWSGGMGAGIRFRWLGE